MSRRSTRTTPTLAALALIALLGPGCAPPPRSRAPDQPPRSREASPVGTVRPAPAPPRAEVRPPPVRPAPAAEWPAGSRPPAVIPTGQVPAEPQAAGNPDLHQAIQRRLGALQRCIKTHGVEDRLRVAVTVAGKTGRVLRVTVTPTRPEAAPLARCVETVCRRLVLRPLPEVAEYTVEVTIQARLGGS